MKEEEEEGRAERRKDESLDVQVCFEEVMRACGGAIAGVREKILFSSSSSSCSGQISSFYGMHEHNRGEDGFLFLPDGGFQHGPDRLKVGGGQGGKERKEEEEEMEVVTSLASEDGKERLRVRVRLGRRKEREKLRVTDVSWSRERSKGKDSSSSSSSSSSSNSSSSSSPSSFASVFSPSFFPSLLKEGKVLRATRGNGPPPPQWQRARLKWEERGGEGWMEEGKERGGEGRLASEEGVWVLVEEEGEREGAVRIEVGGVVGKKLEIWRRVYDEGRREGGREGGALREVSIFRSDYLRKE